MTLLAEEDRWPIRYLLVKETTYKGRPCLTLVREYVSQKALDKFLMYTDQTLWLFVGRIIGPMWKNTDLFFEKETAYRWTPGVGFEESEPPHLPYYRKVRR